MDNMNVEQRSHILLREYKEFIEDEADQGKYVQLVKDLIEDKRRRLIVNINDLRRKNPERAQNLLKNSFEEQLAFQQALKSYISNVSVDHGKDRDFFIGFEGSFGNKHVTPRTLHSKFLGNLICVEGIVTKCSLVHPKVVKSVHYCPATKKVMERTYKDLTSFDAFPSSTVYPKQDEDGNRLETEFGLSSYKDNQIISVQEMPEKAPAGQLPRSVDIICENDLVDRCKPGDRIQVVGSYRCLPNKQGSFTSGAFRAIVIACNITQLSKEANLSISSTDVNRCRLLANSHKNIFDLLAKSLAPSIHGHEYIKKAILCLLLGGVEKVLENGTRLRGDINVLLIGDPSVAKSQLLRYVLCTAPRAIPTTGRGSSGVGLTAAVTVDQETGERRLEAGAMVLADRGVVCIDEFDKMSDMDRTAIHEVMEQGRVTIAKAGIHASLNARCSVLAAANPVYGKYNQYKTPMENIGLQDSLLSRFDLLFVMLDIADTDHDRMIADHVVRMHRYRNPTEQDGEVLSMGINADLLSTQNIEDTEEDKEIPMYEKYDPLLHGNTRTSSDEILSVDFMRKYINFVKIMKPTLTQEASEEIVNQYSSLRSEDMDADVARTQPVTARTLETMIRLATAHAKARLSTTVDVKDAKAAIELVQYAYFKKVLEKEKRKRTRESLENMSDDEENEQRPTRRSRRDHSEHESDEIVSQSSTRHRRRSSDTTPNEEQSINGITNGHAIETMEIEDVPSLDSGRLATFKSSLLRLFRNERADSLNLTYIKENIDTQSSTTPFTQNEITAAIIQMLDDNQIMKVNDSIILI